VLLARIQRDFPNYHPIMEMVRIACDETNPVELRAKMHKAIAPYVSPKLKAVEITGDDGGPLQHRLVVHFVDTP
jgi:hypothetical protein